MKVLFANGVSTPYIDIERFAMQRNLQLVYPKWANWYEGKPFEILVKKVPVSAKQKHYRIKGWSRSGFRVINYPFNS